ncbi:MAG: CARDB domain-containing protein [bacterium]|nr:CARDB domain-containing protein [bacterium]
MSRKGFANIIVSIISGIFIVGVGVYATFSYFPELGTRSITLNAPEINLLPLPETASTTPLAQTATSSVDKLALYYGLTAEDELKVEPVKKVVTKPKAVVKTTLPPPPTPSVTDLEKEQENLNMLLASLMQTIQPNTTPTPTEPAPASTPVSTEPSSEDPVNLVEVMQDRISLDQKKTTLAKVKVYDAQKILITNRPVVWSSTDESIALVNQNGLITAHSGGRTTIYATVEGVSGRIIVTVIPTHKPDYVAEFLSFSPAQPKDGDDMSFFAVTKNLGSDPDNTSKTRLLVSGKTLGNSTVSYVYEGQSFDNKWNTIWRATAGDHTLQICADAEEVILESNENNNCVTSSFTVAAAQ